jgi:PhzF family phenazine biosynthesis protein
MAGAMREFRQVDVFTDTAYLGNPVAVVLDADGLSAQRMREFARWTNLSETTFVLPPSTPDADYRVRIFTPSSELPFAGHPTLGTCHSWLSTTGIDRDVVVQECGAGLITIRRDGERLAFAAPPLVRSGPVDDATIDRITGALRIDRDAIVDAQWVDNGPPWVAVRLADAAAVLAVRPEGTLADDLFVGVVGTHPAGGPADIEVRGFFPVNGSTTEDPVTGSLNASVAQWLLRTGVVTAPYVAAQGTALGRRGRVHIHTDSDGTIWVGGNAITCVAGTVDL